ncbi:MogA/MoaB family molybdenum cofactor biosynthesis protein [Fervidibacillus albus]|uniref:Molybdenum cofactor biosynthesis protein B n=1 Tax=Fervidibacillus albus TaxID=2980026 RepID=A0A9E8LUD2_9BACI|nr:MogA/MoaB family molybdenum cofactor biosynthesis protein [Fervidibacillus albus]WAA09341.1 MogA/MoaB family molybdenum cofactor biosynthesis protein [Fervidibacillus albus]
MNHCHNKTIINQIRCAIITVSDTRTEQTDHSGHTIRSLLEQEGHSISLYEIIPDEVDQIQKLMETSTHRKDIDAIIINGGTGISQRDVTIEAIRPYFQKELPGFGEIFRYLSYQYDIGSKAILSRAICGVANNRIVFSVPGSTKAVKLAMEKLILPEMKHAVSEIHKDRLKKEDER